MVPRVLLPDLKRLRSKVKLSNTNKGDGTSPFLLPHRMVSDRYSDICHRDRYPNDHQTLQEAQMETEDRSRHRWARHS